MNSRIPLLRRRSFIWLLALISCASSLQAAAHKPNFLFIYTDDQRWDAMGVVQREQGEMARFPWLKTPNMDRLAAGGVRFRNAFVTLSLCAPSRAAFLTGRYNHLNGVINNRTPFPLDSVTHATQLRAAGYKTAYIGKWHMGEQSGQRPGFDYSASFIGHGRYQDCPFEINGVSTPTTGWVDDVSTDFAIDWMKQNRDQPFSIVVGFKSPHSPRGGKNLPERLRDLYADETSRTVPNSWIQAIYHKPTSPGGDKELHGLSANSIHLDYLRHVNGADENLGRLLETLDELGLTEDTVVVFTSDNGYFLGEHGLGDKRAIYEESLRIPMLVRYPRLFGKSQVIDDMVLNIDIAPTFLDLAGVSVPREMQGVSWKSLAAGHAPENWRKSFLAEYFREAGDTPTLVGVRTTNAKIVKYTGHPEWNEVFDIEADPYELKNLADDPAMTAKLSAELDAQMKAMNYAVPSNAPKPRRPAEPSLAPIADESGLPRVLLIGDSISMGYTLPVRALLKGKANLHRIPTNGGSTKDGVAHIEPWLGNGKWDVIHFNWGLHDLKHMKDGKLDAAGPQVSTLAEYETNLRALVTRMKATGAKLIWATTTPVPEGSDGRAARDEVKYNEVAFRVMKDMDVPTDDLHALCLPNLASWQLPKNVHFKPEGSAGLAAKVAAGIEAMLEK